MTSVYLETYGCTLNQSESEEIANQLKGHRVVASSHDAQVIVLNTCVVVERTEKKILKRINTLYRQLGDRKLIVSGCMTGLRSGWLRAEYPALLVLTNDLVASYIDAHYVRERVVAPRSNLTGKVKIAHGCLGSCSYCIVRLIKGPITSRSTETIVRDVQNQIHNGAKQIFLTAQDAGAYGLDCGRRLPDLVQALCELQQDFRLRIGMMNVSSILDIVEELVRAFGHPKVYKFLHLPVQSGADRVLEAMGRGYTVSDFKRVIKRFRQAYRDITVSTDFIVGFPTETENDFRATVQLLREVGPLKVNITRFSPRTGTPAFNVESVAGGVVKERSRTLTVEHHRVAYQRNCESVGKTYRALATERGKNHSTILYNDSFRPIVIKRELPLGLGYAVHITRATPTYLVGTLS